MTNEQYYDLIVPYQDALNLLKARLDVLKHSMYGNKSHPIHNIQFRIINDLRSNRCDRPASQNYPQ